VLESGAKCSLAPDPRSPTCGGACGSFSVRRRNKNRERERERGGVGGERVDVSSKTLPYESNPS
jgi:hypothetical protein